MFGLVFLFCSAWTLRRGGHVRIDILSSRLPPVIRVWIDIFGGILSHAHDRHHRLPVRSTW